MQDKRCFTYPWFVLDNIVLFSDDCTSARQIFWYEKNLQGDVVAVYDNNGVKQVSYIYDAWGNTTITTHVSGTAASKNPIRYRSYYYDSDISLYCLGTRWYSTQFRRFLSPDDVSYLGANGDLNSYNLYAYCSNNPVMYTDPSGHVFLSAIAWGAGIGFVWGFISSIVSQYVANEGDWSQVDLFEAGYDGIWGAINGALASTGISAPVSWALGALTGGLSSIGSDLIFDVWLGGETFDLQQTLCNAGWNALMGLGSAMIAGAGANYKKANVKGFEAGGHLSKYLNSRVILSNTIANRSFGAVANQTAVTGRHAMQLVISGVRYFGGSFLGTMFSKKLGNMGV